MRSISPIYESLQAVQALHASGDLPGAIRDCEGVISQAPAHPTANMMLGLLLAQAGRHGPAMPHLRLALAHMPQDMGLRETIASCLIELGEPWEAGVHLRQILAQDPDNANVRFNLGRSLLDLRNYVESERLYSAFVVEHPSDAEAFNHLGLARLGMGDAAGSEECFRAAVSLQAHDPLFHLNLAQALAHQARHNQAEQSYAEAVRLDPESAGIRTKIGWFRVTRGDLVGAQESFEVALVRSPLDQNAAAGLATVHERRGDIEAAAATLAPHIEAGSTHPKVAICHARVSRELGRPEAALVVVRRALEPVLPKLEMAGLRFAEGDVLDAMGETDAAFEAYQRANEAQGLRYDPRAHVDLVDRLIMTFTPEFVASFAGAVSPAPAGTLVVGMPRSGTSLVEQILSTHPQVHGAGELDDFPTMAQGIPSFVPGTEAYPECLKQMGSGLLSQLAEARVQSLAGASSAPVVVDKMPMNFLHLGLVAMVSPGAKIIHCVRNPVDTCLSCYFQHFGGSHYAFSTRLESLATFYRQYERLMRHWARVLPLQILTVRYEDMVDDAEAQSRQMLDFIGLPWAPEVLRFHENRRTVRTASYAQVRRPIYSTSVGRAERYSHRLGPLMGLHSR
jgi:tetratricopeptide (TPR) repeat protein